MGGGQGTLCQGHWFGDHVWKKFIGELIASFILIILSLLFELVYRKCKKASARSYNFGETMLSVEDIKVREQLRVFGTPLALYVLNVLGMQIMKTGVSAFIVWCCFTLQFFDRFAKSMSNQDTMTGSDILHLFETANVKLSLALALHAAVTFRLARVSQPVIQHYEHLAFAEDGSDFEKDQDFDEFKSIQKYFCQNAFWQVRSAAVRIGHMKLRCSPTSPDHVEILSSRGIVLGQFSFSTYMAFSMNQTIQFMLDLRLVPWVPIVLGYSLGIAAGKVMDLEYFFIIPLMTPAPIAFAVWRLKKLMLVSTSTILDQGVEAPSDNHRLMAPDAMQVRTTKVDHWILAATRTHIVFCYQVLLLSTSVILANGLVFIVGFTARMLDCEPGAKDEALILSVIFVPAGLMFAYIFAYLPTMLLGWATIMAVPPYFDAVNQGLMDFLLEAAGEVRARSTAAGKTSHRVTRLVSVYANDQGDNEPAASQLERQGTVRVRLASLGDHCNMEDQTGTLDLFLEHARSMNDLAPETGACSPAESEAERAACMAWCAGSAVTSTSSSIDDNDEPNTSYPTKVMSKALSGTPRYVRFSCTSRRSSYSSPAFGDVAQAGSHMPARDTVLKEFFFELGQSGSSASAHAQEEDAATVGVTEDPEFRTVGERRTDCQTGASDSKGGDSDGHHADASGEQGKQEPDGQKKKSRRKVVKIGRKGKRAVSEGIAPIPTDSK